MQWGSWQYFVGTLTHFSVRSRLAEAREVRFFACIHRVHPCLVPGVYWSGARRTLWGECSGCDATSSAEWTCPLGQEVYNNLAGTPAGTAANIIELDDEEEGEQGGATKPYVRLVATTGGGWLLFCGAS